MARGRPSRATVYARLDASMDQLRDRLGGLPRPREAEYIWADIWHMEAHHSTALEGNTLVLREVEALLDSGRAVGAKPLKEYMEVQGYGEAAQWVYGQALEPGDWTTGSLISTAEVRSIHYRLMQPVWQVSPHPEASDKESPGSFREHDIHPFEKGMTPPTWPLVPAELSEWIKAANSLTSDSDNPMPERLAEVHNKFERVHPFIDGNGRCGRLSLNLLLVRLGYPPVVILKQQRSKYLSAMQKADADDYGPLGEMLARAMNDNLNKFILPNVAGPARMVPLAALADESTTVVALRLAANRGRLDAEKRSDGTWLSSQLAVERYKASRMHPGKQAKGRTDPI